MRILLLTQWFEPEPHLKGLSFARALQERGHAVQVLTGFPNYPGGRVYPGYRIRLWQRECIEGIPVLRVALYPSHSGSALGRTLNYVTFALSAALLGLFLTRRVDVVHVYHPPPTVGLAAMVLKYLRGARFVYDVQDLWPDTLPATGMVRNRLVLNLVERWCRLLYSAAARIVVLSPGFKARLVERGVPATKVSVVYNWARSVPEGQAAGPADPRLDGRFVVLFAGNLGAAQGLETVLESARILLARDPAVCFAFLGSGVMEQRLRELALEWGLTNTVFLGRRPSTEVGAFLQRADALLVHLRPEPLFQITIPSKTQDYLAAGRPILMGVAGDAARLLAEAGAGFAFEPGKPASLAHAVQRLRSLSPQARAALGEAGRRFYDEHLCLATGIAAFEQEFEAAVGSRG